MSDLIDGDCIDDIQHYTGGDPCAYDCDRPATFVVMARANGRTGTFVACRQCLNDAYIRPIENDHVDELELGWDLR